MCLTKSPRKISGLHFRTCLSACSAVGDSMGERAALHPLLPLHPWAGVGAASGQGRTGPAPDFGEKLFFFFLNLWVLLWFVGLESQHVCGSWSSPVQSQELDWMMLVDLFQFRFCDVGLHSCDAFIL